MASSVALVRVVAMGVAAAATAAAAEAATTASEKEVEVRVGEAAEDAIHTPIRIASCCHSCRMLRNSALLENTPHREMVLLCLQDESKQVTDR